jgi:hypothetical protein
MIFLTSEQVFSDVSARRALAGGRLATQIAESPARLLLTVNRYG